MEKYLQKSLYDQNPVRLIGQENETVTFLDISRFVQRTEKKQCDV